MSGTTEQHDEAERADAELQEGVDPQRMVARADEPRQQQAAEAHAAHEDAEQDAQRDRGGTDRQLQELKPDDFVDERGAAGTNEEQQQRRQPSAIGLEAGRRFRHCIGLDHRAPNISEAALRPRESALGHGESRVQSSDPEPPSPSRAASGLCHLISNRMGNCDASLSLWVTTISMFRCRRCRSNSSDATFDAES